MIVVLIGRIAQFAIMFLSVKLMTTLLPPLEMGKIVLVTTGTAFFALFLINPVGMFINRRLHAWMEAGLMRQYFHLYCGYLFAVAVLGACLAWMAGMGGALKFGMPTGWLPLLVGGSLLFNTVNQTLVPSLNMIGRTKPFVFLTIATLLTGLLGSVWLVLNWRAGAEIWLAGGLIGQLVFSLVAYGVFFRSASDRPHVRISASGRIGKLFHFCWPLALAVGLNWAHMQGYRFLLAERVSLGELGLFAAGYGVAASLMAAMEMVLTTWFQPSFYQQANSTNSTIRSNAWQAYAEKMLPSSMIGFAALIAIAPDLTSLMLGPEYQTSTRYVMLGALAEWFRVLVGLFGLTAHLQMNTRSLIIPNLLGAFVTFALLVWLLPDFGLDIAPISVTIGSCVVLAYLYWTAQGSDFAMKLDWSGLLRIVALSAAMVGVVAAVHPSIEKVSGGFSPYLGIALVGCIWGPVTYMLLRRTRVSSNSEKAL